MWIFKRKKLLVDMTPENMMVVIDLLVLLFYSIMLFQGIIGESVLNGRKVLLDNGTIAGILLLLGLVKTLVFFDEDKVKAYAAIALIILIIVGTKTGYNDYLVLGALMFSTYNMQFTKLAKVHVATAFVTLGMLLVLSLLGIIENKIYYYDSRLVRKIQTIGFFNHNQFMLFLFFSILALLYLIYGKKREMLYYLLIFFLLIIFWSITGCNTVMIVGSFACFLSFLYCAVDRYKSIAIVRVIQKWLSIFLLGMPIYGAICTLIGLCLFGKYGYGERLYSLRDRYGMLYQALEKLGIKMPVSIIGDEDIYDNITFSLLNGIGKSEYPGSEYFDILYGRLFVLDGLVAVIIYILITTLIMYRAYKYEQYNILIFMAAYVLLGYSESTSISRIPGNIGMMLLFSSWTEQKCVAELYGAKYRNPRKGLIQRI